MTDRITALRVFARAAHTGSFYRTGRKRTGKGARGDPVQDGTIRYELITFRFILRYAADKHLLRASSVPTGKVLHYRARREAFTPQEYRHLHTYTRK